MSYKEEQKIIDNLKKIYKLTDNDIFYTLSNDTDKKLVYDKNNLKIYYNANYNYIDVIREMEQ